MRRKDKFFIAPQDNRLGNRYKLLELLGEGSYGWVWRAQRLSYDQIVAIKIPKEQGASSADLAEGEALQGRVSHPNIVSVYSMGRVPPENDWYVIEMEYFPSQTLAQLLDRAEPRFAASYSRVLAWYEQVLAGVEYLHSIGMAHGDIKPQNILVSGDQVKLTDFGSSVLPEEIYARSRHNGGTILYSAPEVAGTTGRRGGSEEFFKADIYSLGVLLYHFVTSRLPHDTPSQVMRHAPFPRPREINTSVSPALEDFIMRCLAYSPEDRWPSVTEMSRAFRRVRQAQLDYQPVRLIPPKKEISEDWSSQATRLMAEMDYSQAETVAQVEFCQSGDALAFLLMVAAAYYDQRYFDCIREIEAHPEMLSLDTPVSRELRRIALSCYIETRKIDEAANMVEAAIAAEGEKPNLLLKRASLLAMQAKYEDSAQILIDLNRMFPGRPAIQKRLVLVYEQLRDVGKAAAFLRSYIKQVPDDEWTRNTLERYNAIGVR